MRLMHVKEVQIQLNKSVLLGSRGCVARRFLLPLKHLRPAAFTQRSVVRTEDLSCDLDKGPKSNRETTALLLHSSVLLAVGDL